jgi:hypothetical protein
MCLRGRRHVKRVQARALKMVGIRRALLMITPVNGYRFLRYRSGSFRLYVGLHGRRPGGRREEICGWTFNLAYLLFAM